MKPKPTINGRTEEDYPDIQEIIAEVINREGWVAGHTEKHVFNEDGKKVTWYFEREGNEMKEAREAFVALIAFMRRSYADYTLKRDDWRNNGAP